jgi:drug/metabolite transporter (DMT)-like permease
MSADVIAALWGLVAAISWGFGDFAGGLATRRSSEFSVMRVSSVLGLLFLVSLALLRGSPLPTLQDALLGVAGGVFGVIGLITLYRALATGQMSLVAPITAVVANIVAVAVSVITEGKPGILKWIGFILAGLGVWLLSRPEGKIRLSSSVLILSVVAGVAFGGIFATTAQFSSADAGWSIVCLRLTTVILIFSLIAFQGGVPPLPKALLPLVATAGICDSLGNIFFALASQAGRLDVSAVSSSLYPAFTLLMAVLVLRERLQPWQILGAALCVISIGLIVIKT